jgi:uncharacterized delta-60 repeat protein
MFATSRWMSFVATRRLMCASAAALALVAGMAGVARAATPGTLNPGFGTGGLANVGSNIRLFGAAFQSNGDLVAVGQRGITTGATLIATRLTAAGQADGSFGGGVVAGPAIVSSFGSGSIGRGVAVQSDGKIVVVGQASDTTGTGTLGLIVERFNSNGTLDTSFGSGGVARTLTAQFGAGYAVAIQSDGKIVAAGQANAPGGGTEVAVARFNTNGSLDTSFGSGGTDLLNLGEDSRALGLALQSNGDIVIVGSQAPGLQVPNALIARLTPSGALDSSFNGTGAYAHQYAIGAANSAFTSVAVQSNGDIVAAGAATNGNTGADAIIARFTSAGAPDGSFGHGGVVYSTSAVESTVSGSSVPGASGVAVTSGGDIVAGGTFSDAGLTGIALWGFTSSGAPLAGFGTNGATVTGFGSSLDGEGNALAVAPSGSIGVAGDDYAPGSPYSGVVAEYNGLGGSAPPPPSSLKATLGKLSSQKSSTVAKSGLSVQVGCNEGCKLSVSLGISSGTAKQLKIKSSVKSCKKVHGKQKCTTKHGYYAISIASGKATLSGAGSKTFTLKLSKSVASALKKQKSVKATLSVSATSTSTGKVAKLSKGLTFKS